MCSVHFTSVPALTDLKSQPLGCSARDSNICGPSYTFTPETLAYLTFAIIYISLNLPIFFIVWYDGTECFLRPGLPGQRKFNQFRDWCFAITVCLNSFGNQKPPLDNINDH